MTQPNTPETNKSLLGKILSNAGNAQHSSRIVPNGKERVPDPAHGPVWTQDPIL
jgi:hypothetical protein